MAWAICDDVLVDVEESIIVWTLLASKTDPKAKSCKLKWGCLCAHLCEGLCPFHVFVKYLSALQAVSGRGCIKHDSYPVFPDSDGKVVVKEGMVKARRSLRRRVSCAVIHRDADSLEAIRVKWRAPDTGLPRVLRSCGCKCSRAGARRSCCVTLLTHRWSRPSASTDISRHRHPLSLYRRARMRAKTCSRGSSDGSCLRQRQSFTSCENLSRLRQPAPNRVLCITLCRPCGIVSPGVDLIPRLLSGRQFIAGFWPAVVM